MLEEPLKFFCRAFPADQLLGSLMNPLTPVLFLSPDVIFNTANKT